MPTEDNNTSDGNITLTVIAIIVVATLGVGFIFGMAVLSATKPNFDSTPIITTALGFLSMIATTLLVGYRAEMNLRAVKGMIHKTTEKLENGLIVEKTKTALQEHDLEKSDNDGTGIITASG